jgi:hypothetical protein
MLFGGVTETTSFLGDIPVIGRTFSHPIGLLATLTLNDSEEALLLTVNSWETG